MRGVLIVVFVFLLGVATVSAQGETPTPTPTSTPEPTYTPAPIVARYDTIDNQPVQIVYSITAGDVMIAVLLLLLLFSYWGIGFMSLFVNERDDKRD